MVRRNNNYEGSFITNDLDMFTKDKGNMSDRIKSLLLKGNSGQNLQILCETKSLSENDSENEIKIR